MYAYVEQQPAGSPVQHSTVLSHTAVQCQGQQPAGPPVQLSTVLSHTAVQCQGQQPTGPPVQLGSERQSPPDEWALCAPQNVAPPDESLLLLVCQVEAALQGSHRVSLLQCGAAVRPLRLVEAALHTGLSGTLSAVFTQSTAVHVTL